MSHENALLKYLVNAMRKPFILRFKRLYSSVIRKYIQYITYLLDYRLRAINAIIKYLFPYFIIYILNICLKNILYLI